MLDILIIQLSSAIQYDRLNRLAQRQAFNLDQLHRATHSLEHAPKATEASQAVVDQTARMLGASFAALYLDLDDGGITLVETGRSQGSDGHPEPLSPELLALVQDCLGSGQRREIGIVPEKTDTDAGTNLAPYEAARCLGVPLHGPTGPAGALVLGRSDFPPWSPSESDLLEALTNQIAGLICSGGPARRLNSAGSKIGRILWGRSSWPMPATRFGLH